MKHPLRHLLMLTLIVALAIPSVMRVEGQGQNTEIVAPRVIASLPAQREVVGPQPTIQAFFDQPMDRASVEAALAISPKIEGKVEWSDDSTLTFKPAAALQRGQEYSLTIGTGAQAKNKVALAEPFKLAFAVTANVSVGQVVPAADAKDVEAGASITVVFSRPVVPLMTTGDQAKLPQPLTLSPAVEGKGEWVGTSIYVFKPTKALAGGTLYTATVSGDLKDAEGNPLDQPFSWKFTTIAPRINTYYPNANQQQVPLEAPITIQFNQPMDEASTKAAFSLRNIANGAAVAGTVTFANNGATLTFKPASRLEFGTNYMISMLAGAKSASGSAQLTNPVVARFVTVPLPRVVSTTPRNGDKVAPGGGVQITFSAPMKFESFAGKVKVEPKPENLNVSPGGNQVYIGFASQPATTYTVTLDAGVSDPYGNTIKEPTVITFSTTAAQPSFALAVRDVVAVTSAYRPETVILGAGINISKINGKLAALEPNEALSLFYDNSFAYNPTHYTPPRWTRIWSQDVKAKQNERVTIPINLALDGKGKLAPGIYLLETSAPETQQKGWQPFRQMIVVATAGITLKVGTDEALVWVTDLQSGQPLKGVKVDLYSRDNQKIASGTTDESGLYRHKSDKKAARGFAFNMPIVAFASGEGVFSVGSSNWQQGFQPYEFKVSPDFNPRKDVAYLYTDQPVYRPGHPVYFRGVLRSQDDVNFGVPASQAIDLRIRDAQGKEVYKQTVNLNNYGAFNGKYEPPVGAALGRYTLLVTYGAPQQQTSASISFTVAEFRPPEFIVNAKADKPEVVAGDTIKVDFDGAFFFGGPVSGGKVTWQAIANTTFFSYKGDGNYSFGSGGRYYYYDDNGNFVYNRPVKNGSGVLDDKGKFTVELPADLAGATSAQSFMVEATVTDVSNQSISGRATVTVHPAQVYIGLQPAKYVGQAQQPFEIRVIGVDWASKPQANQNITLKVAEKRWKQDPNTLQWAQDSVPVTEGKVTTDSAGKGTYTFTPVKSGVYEIEATTRDSGERIARTVTTVWVSGPDYFPWNRDQKGLTLVTDKNEYAPGDTASILIPSPFPEPVTALVTVERAGIMKTEVITVQGSTTYKLPLDVIHAPNVYVAVAFMRGSGKEGKEVPELRYGLTNLTVSVQQQLKIKITPSTANAKPGDLVKFDVLITDLQDKPVAAEIGLSMSDLANLSVGRANSRDIFAFFWSNRGLSIMTSSPLSKLIDDLTTKQLELLRERRDASAMGGAPGAAQPTLGAMADGMVAAAPAPAQEAAKNGEDKGLQQAQAPTPRTNFVDTPLWIADLVSGADGRATASVTLPDNLTTWRLDARAISQKTYVGDAELDIVSTKPLLVRPATPRFFVVGDESELAVVVNNNTEKDLKVDVSLTAKGVKIKGDAKQTVSIPKAGRTRVTWMASVEDVETVDLAFAAVSGEFSDASKPAVGIGDQKLLPVYRYLAPDYAATAGVIREKGSRTEAVIVPSAALAPTGTLTLNVQPSLAATTIDGLKYLKNYPYQCVEQTVSRFLPNVITYRALQKLNLTNPELKGNLEEALKFAVAKLQREQKPDGGWGWFPQDQSSPLTSTYALFGLLEAKASDYPVDAGMLQRATAYVLSTIQPIGDQTPYYDLNRQAFTLYVLARAGQPNTNLLDSLFQRREKMHLFARAFLTQAYLTVKGDKSKIDTLLSDLQSKAVVSATGTHWEERQVDWWNWDTNTRTTAIVLQTLVQANPQSDLIPNAVRWLMVARRGTAWESTQETAWALMGLTNWMEASGELKADYGYTVNVNGKSLGDGRANKDTLRDTKTLQVSVADMLREQVNKITVDHGDGPGVLYYTALLTVNQPVEAIKPTNRGINLTRTYYVDGKPVTGAKVGDTITVALEITAANDLYYVNIDDPIPAGTEAIDKSLQTTTKIGQRPQLNAVDVYRRGWGWWWFSNTELRTEKVVLNATFLPRGTYRFVYQIQATSAGTYKVIPPNGNQFYFPEVFGRGAGSTFTITS